jgi:hypothetical protein
MRALLRERHSLPVPGGLQRGGSHDRKRSTKLRLIWLALLSSLSTSSCGSSIAVADAACLCRSYRLVAINGESLPVHDPYSAATFTGGSLSPSGADSVRTALLSELPPSPDGIVQRTADIGLFRVERAGDVFVLWPTTGDLPDTASVAAGRLTVRRRRASQTRAGGAIVETLSYETP